MADEIEELFGSLDSFYPGSKRKRREPVKPKITEPTEWENDYFTKTLPNGKTVNMYTIGALAKALNRPIITIRTWMKEGYIPSSPYRLPSKLDKSGKERAGRRLYTKRMIDTAVEQFVRAGIFNVSRIDWNQHQQVRSNLVDMWDKIRMDETNDDKDDDNGNTAR
jgi:hypothetical protein